MTTDLIHRPDSGALTPARVSDLIEIAIKTGNGPEAVSTIKELVSVAKDMQAMQARNAFNRAFAEFKKRCPPILKTKLGGDASDAGNKLRWMYAPIEEIRAKVDPVLLPLGLSYGWSSDDLDAAVRVTCSLRHEDGHSESASATIRKGQPNRAQTVGMTDEVAMSIAQRRSLSMVLGIVAEDVPENPAGDAERIAEKQAADLDALLAEVESRKPGTTARFLKAMKIERASDLPAFKFAGAVAQLEKLR